MQSARGSILMSLMIAVAILASIMAITTQVISLQKQVLHTKRRLSARNIESAIRLSLNSADTCACHFSSANPAAVDLTVDTTIGAGAALQNLNLPEVRAGCDFSSAADNLLASTNPAAALEQRVESISIRGLQNISGNRYGGQLQILTPTRAEEVAIAPVPIPITLIIDTSAGMPSARPVLGCELTPQPQFFPECPPGFTMVGPPNRVRSYCIDTHARAPATFYDANVACAALTSSLRANICDFNAWHMACYNGVPGLATQAEWTYVVSTVSPSFIFFGVRTGNEKVLTMGGGGTCDSYVAQNASVLRPYRCCLHP
jgi:hypothetical protein